ATPDGPRSDPPHPLLPASRAGGWSIPERGREHEGRAERNRGGGAKRSTPRRCWNADRASQHHGEDDRRLGRPAKTVDDTARSVLGPRRAARVDRHLRRDELLGGAAVARAGDQDGAGRGAWTRVATRRGSGDGGGRGLVSGVA